MQQRLISSVSLPLAIYRELAAHLRQLEGVTTKLLEPQEQLFDYHSSQVGGLLITYPDEVNALTLKRLEEILGYYSQKYSPLKQSHVTNDT